jgi:hypothetical protein
MAMIGHTQCCGLKEIANIHHDWLNTGPRGVMQVLANTMLQPLERWIPDPKNLGRRMNNPQERPFYPRCCHLFFTDHHHFFKEVGNQSVKVRYGKQFARYILKNKLGKLTCSSRAVNPNSTNTITVWVWTFDATRLKEHLEAEFPWKPKPDPAVVPDGKTIVIGSRVRLTDDNNGYGRKGAEGVVTSMNEGGSYRVQFDETFSGGRIWHTHDNARGTCNVILVPPTPQPAPAPPVAAPQAEPQLVAPAIPRPPIVRTTQEGIRRANELLAEHPVQSRPKIPVSNLRFRRA